MPPCYHPSGGGFHKPRHLCLRGTAVRRSVSPGAGAKSWPWRAARRAQSIRLRHVIRARDPGSSVGTPSGVRGCCAKPPWSLQNKSLEKLEWLFTKLKRDFSMRLPCDRISHTSLIIFQICRFTFKIQGVLKFHACDFNCTMNHKHNFFTNFHLSPSASEAPLSDSRLGVSRGLTRQAGSLPTPGSSTQ